MQKGCRVVRLLGYAQETGLSLANFAVDAIVHPIYLLAQQSWVNTAHGVDGIPTSRPPHGNHQYALELTLMEINAISESLERIAPST